MPNPKEVFENYQQYWNFITVNSDDDFEGQHFDRKEVPPVELNGQVDGNALRRFKTTKMVACISAFANSNKDGGLLVLGVSKTGDIKGTDHLRESEINSLMSFNDLLKNYQTPHIYPVECQDNAGLKKKILLIYVPYVQQAICETLSTPPKAWIRSVAQNLQISERQREQLKREKQITNFENVYCCPFHIDDVDQDVLQQFREVYLENANYDLSDEELLYEVGAIDRAENGYVFNNAGFLFFARNPQRQLSWAYIRLMRFEAESNEVESRGLPTFDRKFEGSIIQQIRRIRSFLRESGFFKTYQKRNPDGGFVDEPEFPHIAVDESIVNAVAHRDYGTQIPIECIHYKNAFVVENSGRILQRDRDLPSQFSLQDTTLRSMPRNSKLIEWLKMIRDEDGAEFVKALSEGTRRMRDEMHTAKLHAPSYKIGDSHTIVTLFNNATEREALLRAAPIVQDATEFTNLFPLHFETKEGQPADLSILEDRRKDFMIFLKDALRAKGWYVDRLTYGTLTVHRQKSELHLPQEVQNFVRFYPAYKLQLRSYWNKFYLCIDYTLEVKNILRNNALLRRIPSFNLEGRRAVAQLDDWHEVKIIKADTELTHAYFFDLDREETISSNNVIPDLPIDQIKKVLRDLQIQFDLSKEIKRHSLALDPSSARIRVEKTTQMVQDIKKSVFPLIMGNLNVFLYAIPEPLSHGNKPNALHVQILHEPSVEFRGNRKLSDIREGITKFGTYEDPQKAIELVPICTDPLRNHMKQLIGRLKTGKYKYRGSERTFSTRFQYNHVVPVSESEKILGECQRLLDEHPNWIGAAGLNRLFLVHTPEQGYARDDQNAPYYRIKRFLLENGIPCQMVDTPTLFNPDWKDLNLGLNIIAKCGVTPWVLPNSIPDADFFIGLSYTRSRAKEARRLVGYATVFNEFGRWEFYLGNTGTFSYEERTQYFADLTKQTLKKLTQLGKLSESPSIYFHYSARFSRDDRQAMLKAARSIYPNGIYSFVSVNLHHNIRLYDNRAETDGSLSRGSYVVTAPHQILISTTGYNAFQKSLGTPKPLEVTIWTERPETGPNQKPDLKSLAVQILSLTKLNWASTNSLCGEPITTKYAGDIAYLTDAFRRQSGEFRLHPTLEATPWFI